jgi:ankyrin repeat protein
MTRQPKKQAPKALGRYSEMTLDSQNTAMDDQHGNPPLPPDLYLPPPLDRVTVDLWRAIDRKDIAECRVALDQGADPNGTTGARHTIFTHAISRRFEDAAALMLSYGAAIEAVSIGHISPLFAAASTDQLAIAKSLLARGAAVDYADPAGNTALLIAARSSSVSVGRFLIDGGANVHVYDNRSRTMLHKAVHSNSDQSLEFTELALSAGADPDFAPPSPTDEYLTPFQWAMSYARPKVSAYLIEHYAHLAAKPTLAGQHLLEIANDAAAPLLMAALTGRSVETGLGEPGTQGKRNLASPTNGPL